VSNTEARQRGPQAIRSYLATLGAADLVELVVEVSERDDRLRQRLLLKSGDRDAETAAVKDWKKALSRATSSRRFVDWREMPSYTRTIDELLDRLDEWFGDGRAADVVTLAEYAAGRVEACIEHCDDSNGEIGGLLTRIGALHLAACKQARPDPVALAKRLFTLELNGAWDTFANCAELYAEILGESGLRVFRKLANAEWASVPALGPQVQAEEKWESGRFRITRMMESLARQSGDVEELVRVMSRDLSSAWQYLQVAQVYSASHQADRALEWAERGLAEFAKRPDSRLQDFVIEEYLRRRRDDEALELAWSQFQRSQSVEVYEKLHRVAKIVDRWPACRERALAFLRADIASEFAGARKSKHSPQSAPNQSRLVRLLLWEKDYEAAWQAAISGLCDESLWLELADRRASAHPTDALPIYQRLLLQSVAQTSSRGYQQGIALLKKIWPLYIATHGQRAFERYSAELRVATRQKRNFIKLLDELLQRGPG
jgi:hypothetical protein